MINTMEVTNRFMGLELWMDIRNILQEARPSPWKRNAKKQNGCLGGLTNSCEEKRSKKQRRK